jgi:hypothetical protein
MVQFISYIRESVIREFRYKRLIFTAPTVSMSALMLKDPDLGEFVISETSI